MPTASRPRRLPRRLLALASGNWLARGYLAVFAVSLTAMFLFPESALAGSPLLLTAPLSFLAVFLPSTPAPRSPERPTRRRSPPSPHGSSCAPS
ncbi:hypothetical protein O1L60_20825 [Streptomyces diastatochromogenes]|nr:hypothetical protein [Streptomyces diastatochromogenes]